jgi:D-alanyl-D-alanine carboxypeptidase
MNEKAKALGMNDTYFDDPSGLSFLNVSNTVDLFSLARFIYKELPEIFDITRINEYAIPKHRWVNGNSLSRKSSFVGGKNGYTDEALRTTASIFELNLKQKDNLSKTVKRKIAIIVLKSNDREGDVDKLIRFAENAFVFAPKN